MAKSYLCWDILNLRVYFSTLNFLYRIQACLLGLEYWMYIRNVFLFSFMILFLPPFLGILSDGSYFLHEEGKCTKEKDMSYIINENSN